MGFRTGNGRPYSKSYTHKILTNPFYIGINRHNGKEYPGAQEPIISKEIFNRVQTKLRRKLSCTYRTHNPVFKNVIRCISCGRMVTWQLQKGRYYGGCQRRSKACRANTLLREDRLEKKIEEMLQGLVSPQPEVIDWLSAAMRARHEETIATNEQIISSIQMQLDRVNRMDSNLYDDKLSGEISASTYAEKHEAFTEQRQALEAKLAGIDRTMSKGLEQRLVLLELSQKSAEIYKKKSPNQKRIIISKLFDEFKYEGGILSVNYTKFALAIAQNVQKTHQILGGKI